MLKITPCLWFDNQAAEAAKFYVSIFKNSKLGHEDRYGDSAAEVSGQPKGSVMTVPFTLEGQPFLALNGGPLFKLTEAVSFIIDCETQEEVDYFWDKLLEGGTPSQCGWLKDKFGLSWQVVPKQLNELLSSGDPLKTEKVMVAMLKMIKLDIAGLEAAAK